MEKTLAKRISFTTLVENVVVKLENIKHKGDSGLVGVVGGSIDYTGAPYYSAVSAIKSGSDLSHVFCHIDAATPIKSYSPELIVHPSYDHAKFDINQLKKAARWFKAMTAIVIGPGLGRQEGTDKIFDYLFKASLELDGMVNVVDADGLWYLMQADPTEFGCDKKRNLILTPNKNEFQRLYNKLVKEKEEFKDTSRLIEEHVDMEQRCDNVFLFEDISKNKELFVEEIELTGKLNNSIIVKKGKYDVITNGICAYVVCARGSLKRIGGIGDILGGLIATYSSMVKKRARDEERELETKDLLKACALACIVSKRAAAATCDRLKFALTAPDVIDDVVKIARNYYN